MTTPTPRHEPQRCAWADESELMGGYHDTEWGFPVSDDRRLFEKLCLEGFQAGLSWRTILTKRPAFRRAFHDFDTTAVAELTEADVAHLLDDSAIIRHRGKIEATINNAQRALALVEETGSLAAYLWQYEAPPSTKATERTTSPEAIALSKDLKRRGWRFVGPTTAYAFMQAMGLVNDHVERCDIRAQVQAAREAFTVPVG